MLPQFISSTILVVVVAIAAYGFTTRGFFVLITLISAPVLIYLASHPTVWMIWVLALSKSGVI